MNRLGFDNEKYVKLQSQNIRDRISKFGGKLYLEIGGKLEFATDHEEYFHTVEEHFAGDARFARVEPMVRGPEEWTEFETLFRGQGLPIHAAAWKSLPVADERPLAPLTVAPEDEPREGIVRRVSRGKEWREEQRYADCDEERQV